IAQLTLFSQLTRYLAPEVVQPTFGPVRTAKRKTQSSQATPRQDQSYPTSAYHQRSTDSKTPPRPWRFRRTSQAITPVSYATTTAEVHMMTFGSEHSPHLAQAHKIGRASCRERV